VSAPQQAQYDPGAGAAALASFGGAKGNLAYLSGQNLRAGLLASLYSVEMLAATAGVVPFLELDGVKGVAVLGGARDKLASAPESVRTIYLAAHGAARQAQAHAREASSSVPLSQRTDGALATVQQSIGVVPLAVVVVVTVIGVAGIVATAWFAKGVAEKIVQTHADDLRASYAVDQASKLAMAQIAAGQPVDPGIYEVLKAAAKKEQEAPFTIPAWAFLGAGAIGVALLWKPLAAPISDAIKWSQALTPLRNPKRGGRTSGFFTSGGS
jgi:hypothetical protein